jgi:hypothetical protein
MLRQVFYPSVHRTIHIAQFETTLAEFRPRVL